MTPREIHESQVAKAASRPATQSELLSTIRLQLNPTVRRSTAQPKRVLLRSSNGRQRLVLTLAQASILTNYFAEACTVPDALARLLGERDTPPWTDYGCPPLSEFYELVLQAHAAGVLVEAGAVAQPTLARSWPLGFPVGAARVLGSLAILASIAAIVMTRVALPASGKELLVGWLIACGLLSLGQMLAAGSLVSAGAEARGFQFHWRSLFPHFRIDVDEAVMGGRSCALAVATLSTTPVAIGAAVIAWQAPGWLAPVLAGFFYVLAPWRGSAAWQWIEAYRLPRYSVRAGALFEPRREDLWTQWLAWCADIRPGVEMLSGVWMLVWSAAVALAALQCWPVLAETTLSFFGSDWRVQTAMKSGLIAVAVALVAGMLVLVNARIRHWRLHRAAARPLQGDDALRQQAALAGNVVEVLRKVPLFQSMPKLDLVELAAMLKLVSFRKSENVFVEDAPGDAFYLVLDGEFEILKKRAEPEHGMARIGRLGAGDCFGEIALLEGTVRSATVRTVRAGRVLQLSKWDFMKLVTAQVGTAKIHDLLQHAVFLGRLVFMAGWPFADLVRFAQNCTTQRYAAGSQILRKGENNAWFFLAFDGAFEVRDGGQVLRRVQPGDYFGDISLLENGSATADVVALEESRCLVMHRNDFLSFFSHDYRISLRMEALAAERLGGRLFVSR
jgi:CRP-like cAMP-binding protein